MKFMDLSKRIKIEILCKFFLDKLQVYFFTASLTSKYKINEKLKFKVDYPLISHINGRRNQRSTEFITIFSLFFRFQ